MYIYMCVCMYFYIYVNILYYVYVCVCGVCVCVCMCVCARTPYNIIYICTHVHIVYIINMPSDSLQRNLYILI